MEQYQNQMNGNHPASGATALVERNLMQGTELAHITDQTNVLAQQAVAAIQARYVLAVNRPRNIDMVRQNILKECNRPSFARVATYHKPVGKGVDGPSIRFAEMAIRCMGNLFVETMMVSDTQQTRVIRVTVSDLETNASYYKDIAIAKTVERSSLKQGQTPIKTRHNSYGKIVYIVEATEDDLLSKEASHVSKAIRTCALRLVPGDILEEALETVYSVLKNEAAKDPDAARKKLVDVFSQQGITAEKLAKYLGESDLSAITADQITHLQGVYYTIKDGEATWSDIYEASPYRDSNDESNINRDSKAEALQKKIEDKLKAKKKKPAEPAAKSTPKTEEAKPQPVPETSSDEPQEQPEPELNVSEPPADTGETPESPVEPPVEPQNTPKPKVTESEDEGPTESAITNNQRTKMMRLAQILYPQTWTVELEKLIGQKTFDSLTESDGAQYIAHLEEQTKALMEEAEGKSTSTESEITTDQMTINSDDVDSDGVIDGVIDESQNPFDEE